MINWLKEWKKLKLAKQKEEAEARKAVLEKSLIASNKEMLGNPCAVNSMNPCVENCTHFQGAEIRSWLNPDPPIVRRYLDGAKCKLWGKH